MNLKIVLIVVSLLFISPAIYSQNPDHRDFLSRKNSVDLTIAGVGLGFSANYSRILMVKEKYFVVASAGIGTIPSSGGISIPHQVSFNFGKSTSFFEAGLGGVFWKGKSDSSGFEENINSYDLLFIAGWRKYLKHNLYFRAYASPVIYISGEHFVEDYAVLPYMGVSLGYTF